MLGVSIEKPQICLESSCQRAYNLDGTISCPYLSLFTGTKQLLEKGIKTIALDKNIAFSLTVEHCEHYKGLECDHRVFSITDGLPYEEQLMTCLHCKKSKQVKDKEFK